MKNKKLAHKIKLPGQPEKVDTKKLWKNVVGKLQIGAQLIGRTGKEYTVASIKGDQIWLKQKGTDLVKKLSLTQDFNSTIGPSWIKIIRIPITPKQAKKSLNVHLENSAQSQPLKYQPVELALPDKGFLNGIKINEDIIAFSEDPSEEIVAVLTTRVELIGKNKETLHRNEIKKKTVKGDDGNLYREIDVSMLDVKCSWRGKTFNISKNRIFSGANGVVFEHPIKNVIVKISIGDASIIGTEAFRLFNLGQMGIGPKVYGINKRNSYPLLFVEEIPGKTIGSWLKDGLSEADSNELRLALYGFSGKMQEHKVMVNDFSKNNLMAYKNSKNKWEIKIIDAGLVEFGKYSDAGVNNIKINSWFGLKPGN